MKDIDLYSGRRIKICCRTCASWRVPPCDVRYSERYCSNKKAKPTKNNDDRMCFCGEWKPSRDAVRVAILRNGKEEGEEARNDT